MPKPLLAGLALIALVACGGGSHERSARAQARARAPEASKSTATTKAGAPAKRKGAAKPDTAGQRNPLVNH